MTVKKLAWKVVFTVLDVNDQDRVEKELRFTNPGTVVVVQNQIGAVVGVYQKVKK